MISATSQKAVVKWLAGHRTGVSSETMAFWLGFGIKPSTVGHPWNPADLDRCLRLIDEVPELRGHLKRMSALSRSWALLIERWSDIEQSHLDEVGLGWTKARTAPRTYALMKEVLSGKSAASA